MKSGRLAWRCCTASDVDLASPGCVAQVAGGSLRWSGLPRAAELTLLGEPSQWSLIELKIAGVPAAADPFDPEAIRVDANLRAPSGSQQAVPGFYFRAYSRSLVGDDERLSAAKTPEWRLRFRPVEAGPQTVTATIFTNGQPAGPAVSLDEPHECRGSGGFPR